MSEQSGRNESSERPGSGSERPEPEGPGSERGSTQRSGSERASAQRSGSGVQRSSSERGGSQRSSSGAQRSSSARQRQSTPASDMLSDLQRWLLRSSAKSMGRELGGQVRRTLGGGRQQQSASDIWDTATNEIPPEVGESPECQWCPICRAARRVREGGGSGIGGQLSGAGDAVASVVQDAIGALDSILSRAGSSDQRAAGSSRPPASAKPGSTTGATARGRAESKPDVKPAGRPRPNGADRSASRAGAAHTASAARDRDPEDPPASPASPASLAGDHGPGGWKPGDRLATEHVIDPDPWAGATEADDGIGDTGEPGTDAEASSPGPDEAKLNGQGHGPDDRS
jgi:hypothetical protein